VDPRLPAPLLPDYGGPCLSNVVPALLARHDEPPAWLPEAAHGADQVVLLALDGLGWDQLRDRLPLAPTLAAMPGGQILTVAPSTTATALSSLTLGAPPGEHGVVGYRINVRGDVLNVLRWQTPGGDARSVIPPDRIQARAAFCDSPSSQPQPTSTASARLRLSDTAEGLRSKAIIEFSQSPNERF